MMAEQMRTTIHKETMVAAFSADTSVNREMTEDISGKKDLIKLLVYYLKIPMLKLLMSQC